MKKDLFIIGNGFDQAHHLPTSYSDFRSFLEKNKHGKQIQALESIYNEDHQLWSQFEKSLANPNIQNLLKFTDHYFNEIEKKRVIKTRAIVDDYSIAIENAFDSLRDEIVFMFNEWIRSIDIDKVNNLFSLPKDALFLSFNYTHLLEKIYHINSSQILHIHGYCDENSTVIFGYEDKNSVIVDDSLSEFQKNELTNYMNVFHKDTSKILSSNPSFFSFLKGQIDNIFVLGHSLDIDHLYFNYLHQIAPDAHWHISIYGDTAEDTIKDENKKKSILWGIGIHQCTFNSIHDICSSSLQ
ncbi:MAG: bacteriophage abortive infection AbiH family protein [Bacteroides heparinolyticus]|nr:bacteriophage abortive infection AbiH family protein [Bacteroides heparinolyticus]